VSEDSVFLTHAAKNVVAQWVGAAQETREHGRELLRSWGYKYVSTSTDVVKSICGWEKDELRTLLG
jgi:glutamate mutase epsilon subunit